MLFFKEWKWYEIYDFIEFCVDQFPFNNKNIFIQMLNNSLTEGNSAYRIISEKVTEITSEQEIQSIEEAVNNTNPYSGVQQHLKQALTLMSDRKNPDYRNSIKESISAVESICKIVTQDEKATLCTALKIIEDKFGLHQALKKSLSQLYGYTSDADGIRHAMLEESNLTYIDAKFMLVACTNFINYLINKTK
ncbi:AbiJ-NTD4 domain-containing protein [Acinetobacter sp.]|uniref:AbiJ-NTD4 domain-containing protein n=1 Tax=Acinetobacter sp. TaxID=472 RepID=UPI00388DC488